MKVAETNAFNRCFDQVEYQWTGPSPVTIGELAINDYSLVQHTSGYRNSSSKLGIRSVLTCAKDIQFKTLSIPCFRLEFILQRTLGFYFLRTYFPLILIVASSWVSFWLVRTPAGGEIVARVGLGITCCLGMVTDN